MIVLTVAMILLSIAAGIAKFTLVPDELAFLSGFGFSETAVVMYGTVQMLGGILFAVPRSSVVGAIVVILGFLLSSVLLFIAGDIAFATFSLLPITLTGIVLFHTLKTKNKN